MQILTATACVLSFLSTLCTAQNKSSDSFIEVLKKQTNLTSFTTLLEQQLPAILKALEATYEADTKPVTILAPSDHAFERLQYSDVLSPIFLSGENNTALMSQVVAYHVLEGSWTTETLNTSFKFLPSMTSTTNFSRVTGGQRVGAVLQPGLNTTNYEWEMVFTSGEATRSVVTVQDIPFAGGIIQILDNFLIPPIDLVPTIEPFNLANPPFALTAFLGALYSTGPNTTFQKYLNSTKDLTIFVPANVAFETVSKSLESMSPSTLQNLLSYHVMPGLLYSEDFTNDTSLTMYSNQSTTMRFYPNSFFVNSARILQSDIMIYNGVMHVIDVVLDPNEELKTRLPNPTSATQMAVLPTTGITRFNASEAPFTTFLPNFVPTETPTTTTSEDLLALRTSTGTGFGASRIGSSLVMFSISMPFTLQLYPVHIPDLQSPSQTPVQIATSNYPSSEYKYDT
ncbi:Fasciclin-like arabinogalactan protein [Pseudocercospora fuligena]|uniref:Fasciclin-like arabinogalactan protein n=1 Tax=Pseudocercospora fuligena TaxID=685502 RepID=A0A8H6RQF2_9PEZI|nr:Fasciclin-like arabinogalactan protein [Pseudocercospora fuligena]